MRGCPRACGTSGEDVSYEKARSGDKSSARDVWRVNAMDIPTLVTTAAPRSPESKRTPEAEALIKGSVVSVADAKEQMRIQRQSVRQLSVFE